MGESVLDLSISELNLAEWRSFLGTNLTGGTVNGKLGMTVRDQGKDISLALDTRLTGLAGIFGANHIDRANLGLALRAQVRDFSLITLSSLQMDLDRAGEKVLAMSASGGANTGTFDVNMKTSVEAWLSPLATLLGNPDLKFSSGSIRFDGQVVQKNTNPVGPQPTRFDQAVTGQLALAQLTGHQAANTIERLAAQVQLDVAVQNQVANIRQCRGSVEQRGQAAGAFEVAGQYDLGRQAGALTLKLNDLNQHFLNSFLAAALGDKKLETISVNANVAARYDARADSSVEGDLSVVNLLITDPLGALPRVPMTVSTRLNAGLSGKGLAELRQLNGTITQGTAAGGGFSVTASYDLSNQVAQATLKLTDLNENALRPFLASALGDKKLAKVSINADLVAGYNPKAESTVKGGFQMRQLVVDDPSGKLPNTPLEAGFNLDASLAKNILDLRQAQVVLTPTSRAKNQLQLQGRVDMTRTNAISGKLLLAAESLDFTTYYDLFTAGKTAEKKPGTGATPAPVAVAKTEPVATVLPFTNFVAELNIGRLFLHDINVSNWVGAVRVDGGRVQLNPFKLQLNGAPVEAKADVNLAVPGYTYNVGFNIQQVPITPFLTTFSPKFTEAVRGEILGVGQISGAGMTGADLKKNLLGNLGISLTNASINIESLADSPALRFARIVLLPVSLALQLPEIMRSPIQYIGVKSQMGGGNIQVKELQLRSPVLLVESVGVIPIAEVLTNSPLDFPVEIALSSAAARNFRLLNSDTGSGYSRLPNFVKVHGTIGEPKVDVSKTKILGITAVGAAGFIKGGAGDVVSGIGGLLGGKRPDPATNAPATTTTNAPINNLLNNLFGPKTNAPATKPSDPATNAPINNLIRGLFRR
jgi:hypothetical protein